MDELEFALENIDGQRFEDLAMAFLRREGYDVHESGSSGADGGWDARIEMGGSKGIAHVSAQNRWRRKLRDDAAKVRELEESQSEDYDLFVFVTNQEVSGKQELKMENEIEEEYGWKLRIIHKTRILGELRQTKTDLAEQFLDIDLGTDRDHLAELEGLRDNRLNEIRDRSGYASDLDDGPAVVLHIIPNGIFSKEKVRSSGDIPDPSVLFEEVTRYTETRGKYRISYGRGGGLDERMEYGVLQNDGLYESVSTSAFVEGGKGELWIQGGIRSSGVGLDPSVVLTVRNILDDLNEMGFSGTAFISLAFLDASDSKLSSTAMDSRIPPRRSEQFGTDYYATELYPVQIGGSEVIGDIEPVLSEIWRQFGYEEGTPNIEEDEWVRGSISINRETLLEEGDR